MKLNKLVKGEKGQALMIVVLLMLVSALVIAPMLAHVSTGLKTGREVYEERMYGQYAADSGVEDALYKIQMDDPSLPEEWDGAWLDSDAYTPYSYTVSSPVNGNDVGVTIQPQWVLEGLEDPPPGMTPHADLVVVGDTIGEEDGNGLYQISISYDRSLGELTVERVGAWLPDGAAYVPGSSNLEDDPDADCYCIPVEKAHRGGTAIIWDFGSPPIKFEDLPGEGDKRIVTLQFTPKGHPSSAFSWVKAKRSDIYLSWDVDLKFYRITSDAEDIDTGKIITVEAYTAKNELRPMGDAISGDYVAIGNTLMTATGNEQYRNRLYKESSATLQSSNPDDLGYIPSNARVDGAFLYWSGWIEGAAGGAIAFSDDCSTFVNNWVPGSNWTVQPPGGPGNKEFMGQGGGTDASRTLSMYLWNNPPTYSLDLSPYSGQEVTVFWKQRTVGGLNAADRLYYAFSGDGGNSWSEDIEAFRGSNPSSTFSEPIPDEYVTSQFQMRFFADFNRTSEYVYIDDITISASSGSSVGDAKVNRVLFNGQQVTANLADCQTAPTPDSGAPDSYSYSCYYDATSLVDQLIAGGSIAPNGAGTYTLSHWTEGNEYSLYGGGSTDYPLATPALSLDVRYMYTYAGWSLVVIYSSPDTEGHQLFLFDEFRYIKPHTEGLKFSIGGFLVPDSVADEEYAAHMTCFVGDGDVFWPGDFIALNAPDVPGYQIPNSYKLWDGTTTSGNSQASPNNVWNSTSVGLSANGIDIDNFEVPWDSDLLEPGDTSAEVVLNYNLADPSGAELIDLVYIIISFRSSITSGGTISYLLVN